MREGGGGEMKFVDNKYSLQLKNCFLFLSFFFVGKLFIVNPKKGKGPADTNVS